MQSEYQSQTQEKRSLYTCLDGTHIYTVFTRLDLPFEAEDQIYYKNYNSRVLGAMNLE